MSRPLKTHEFDPDGIPTRHDRPEIQGCKRCPMPEQHSVHDVDPQAVHAAQVAEKARYDREEA